MTSKLSIVIPIYNESQQLPELFDHLSPYRERGHQIIFVDGESEDNSVELIDQAGFVVVPSTRSRAAQMNNGARQATQDILLFLHADTRLPENADALIVSALSNPRQVWGRFDAHITGDHFLLTVVGKMMSMRSRLTGIATGDQGIFIKRTFFENIGGYASQPLMEDVEISRRLVPLAKPVCLRECVSTSGRRWIHRGVMKTIALMWYLRFLYWRGVDPKELAKKYR
ncbi:TIGR04283 family arsenosugar biosynthesis glycosyltransferase [Sessilibacter corallicola]|uniref:TIGR04283 family arsenosugar biosynthesis glycosyltransferase n=1 Tax=Sessilibacter corallicola TaxID=2904075 RepID=UPI001E64ADCE|nr:TIGR04283 family arsenosugar biosynthesis glycosyltransferase [Sessilibacter corallicola]MCE2028284.1 TIGR04283 family arsenosugar biosynthesis glycosyltransferase [Sessilibacter corallicola]